MTQAEFENSHDLIKISTAIHLLRSVTHDEGIADIIARLTTKEKHLHHSFEVEDDEPIVNVPINVHVNDFSVNWEADEDSGQH